jgi:hypothetical protein
MGGPPTVVRHFNTSLGQAPATVINVLLTGTPHPLQALHVSKPVDA